MAKIIQLSEYGDTDKFAVKEMDLPFPSAGEVLVEQKAIGVNFIDIYQRTGFYPLPQMPAILGMEAAGVVKNVGAGVKGLRVGDRVAYGGVPGGYVEKRIMKANCLVKIPSSISFDVAAAAMVRGITAHFLLHRTFPVQKGDTMLVYAAAGGVGSLLCQWGKYLGAKVIGAVGSVEKAALARQWGCDYPILYREDNLAESVKTITQGRGVDVVYDSVGNDTWQTSLKCLKMFGMLVAYGQSSGKVENMDMAQIAKGSYYLTRPSYAHHVADRDYYREAATEVFRLVEQGGLKVHIGQQFALSDAAKAHEALASGKTIGATLLIP